MRDVSDDKSAADAALRAALEASVRAAESRPLTEVLAVVADDLLQALGCRWTAIVLWAADGRPEVVVLAGDEDAARAEITGPHSTADLPSGVTQQGPDDVATTRLSAPLLLRGRAVGMVQTMGPADDSDLSDPESTVHVVAAGIGAIVERSRTVEANRRRERWLSGGTEIVRALTTTYHPDPLSMIAERAAEIAGADSVVLLSPDSAPGRYRVDAAAGSATAVARQQVPDTQDGAIGRVFSEGRAVRVDTAASSPSSDQPLVGATLFAPMHGSTGLRGVMGFGRTGRGAFTEAEQGMATMFSNTVALALELAESQSRREQTALILERDRIARDLHDHVIQRLYAIGLTMQHVSSLVGAETAERLVTAVTDIDAAIAQIRSTIFRLTTPILGADVSLRARAEALVDELEPVLGYRPALVSEGPLDFGLDDDLVTDCEAVLREGITNIARHARATRADVKIAVGGQQVQIEISDDGRGLGDADRRSGLANMRQRAEQHGGTLEVSEAADGTGTRLVWTVPLG